MVIYLPTMETFLIASRLELNKIREENEISINENE